LSSAFFLDFVEISVDRAATIARAIYMGTIRFWQVFCWRSICRPASSLPPFWFLAVLSARAAPPAEVDHRARVYAKVFGAVHPTTTDHRYFCLGLAVCRNCNLGCRGVIF